MGTWGVFTLLLLPIFFILLVLIELVINNELLRW